VLPAAATPPTRVERLPNDLVKLKRFVEQSLVSYSLVSPQEHGNDKCGSQNDKRGSSDQAQLSSNRHIVRCFPRQRSGVPKPANEADDRKRVEY
jgi:hypothetical protein